MSCMSLTLDHTNDNSSSLVKQRNCQSNIQVACRTVIKSALKEPIICTDTAATLITNYFARLFSLSMEIRKVKGKGKFRIVHLKRRVKERERER
jgi:hypothetical protein